MRRPTRYRELRIRDVRNAEEHLLVPLASLIREVEAVYPNLRNAEWTIVRGASGYGEFVCSIEDQLETQESLKVLGASIVGAIADDEQHFNHVASSVEQLGIEFGVHDSTFLYFRGPEEALLAISRAFTRTEIVPR